MARISNQLFIDRVALAKQGAKAFGSVHPSVRQCALSLFDRPPVHPSVYIRLFVCALPTDIRGSALLSAAKSNRSHYQPKVFVCVSVIRQHIRIIVQMQSIGF